MTNRRGFLTGFGAAAIVGISAPAVARVAPMMKLWVPKSSRNRLLTSADIMREAVRMFKNSNSFIVERVFQYDEEFGISGAKIGSTLRIRLPNDYKVLHPDEATVNRSWLV